MEHRQPPEKKSAPPDSPPQRPSPPRTLDVGSQGPVDPAKLEPGGVVWRFPVLIPGQGVPAPALRNSVAVNADGRMFAAIGRNLICLREEGGKLEKSWEKNFSGMIPGPPCIGIDGRIRVHATDSLLHAFHEDGERVFSPVDVGEPLGWAAPVSDEDGNTYVCSYHGGLVKVDPRGERTGGAFFRSRQKFDSTGCVHKRVLYVGAEDAFIYAIDLDGKRGVNRWDQLAGDGKTEWFINSAPALAPDESIIVAGRDEFLYAFSPDGKLRWKVHIRGQMLASPVIHESGDVIVGVSLVRRGDQSSGKLVRVAAAARRVKWEFRAHGPVESTPVIGEDGMIYFGDNSGAVHALGGDGQVRWTRNCGSPVRSAGAIVGKERVVFGLDNGTLIALKCSSESIAHRGWPKYMKSASQSGLS